MKPISARFETFAQHGLQLALRYFGRRQMAVMLAATRNPRQAQSAVLARIIAANAATEFGQEHGFSTLADDQAYQRNVPPQSYESLRLYIDKQATARRPYLTAEQPIFYARTSGTTAEPKFIPVTKAGFGRFRQRQKLFAYAQLVGSRIYQGKILGIGSAATEGHLANGTPYGSMTGLFYRNMPWLIRRKFVLPAEVFEIADYEIRYRVMATLALAEANITGIATANPSTLIRLLSVINLHLDGIISDLAAGRVSDVDTLTPAQRRAVERGFTARQGRARQLQALRGRGISLSIADLWPDLQALVTWTGGSCAIALKALKPALPERTQIIEAGYLSSECRGSINIDVAQNICLPTLLDHFFEFVEQEEWEAGRSEFLRLDQIVEGRRYYLFVTTPDGLYRYDMNDIIAVTGFVNATPTIAFLQKGKGVTNITGEKLYESQIIEAVAEAGVATSFYVVLADEECAEYRLYLESTMTQPLDMSDMAQKIERQLYARNSEYADKRQSGRLAALRCYQLQPGTDQAYRRHCVDNGQRDGQFKIMPLQYARECSFDFESWRILAG